MDLFYLSPPSSDLEKSSHRRVGMGALVISFDQAEVGILWERLGYRESKACTAFLHIADKEGLTELGAQF